MRTKQEVYKTIIDELVAQKVISENVVETAQGNLVEILSKVNHNDLMGQFNYYLNSGFYAKAYVIGVDLLMSGSLQEKERQNLVESIQKIKFIVFSRLNVMEQGESITDQEFEMIQFFFGLAFNDFDRLIIKN